MDTTPRMETIAWADFERVVLAIGTIVRAEAFPEARKPAYQIWADFGPEHGVRKSSAQITALYTPAELVGRQIIGVLNFPVKQIGPFRSEFLLTGFHTDDGIVIAMPERAVPNGARLI
jgi:tRNA-binding protein